MLIVGAISGVITVVVACNDDSGRLWQKINSIDRVVQQDKGALEEQLTRKQQEGIYLATQITDLNKKIRKEEDKNNAAVQERNALKAQFQTEQKAKSDLSEQILCLKARIGAEKIARDFDEASNLALIEKDTKFIPTIDKSIRSGHSLPTIKLSDQQMAVAQASARATSLLAGETDSFSRQLRQLDFNRSHLVRCDGFEIQIVPSRDKAQQDRAHNSEG